MRLSWYADTGVAVFSIWQAGMCTGTFRLPIGDLSRMIEILERGPSPQGRGRAPVSGGRRGPERGRGEYGQYPAEVDEIGLLDSPAGSGGQGGYAGADYTAEYGGTGQYAQGGYDGRPAAGDRGTGDRGASAGPGPDGGTADYPAADYGSAGYGDPGHEQASYGDASHRGPAYGAERPRDADYGAAGYEPADYGAGEPDGRGAAAYDYNSAGYGRGGYAEDDAVRRGGAASDDYARGSYGSAGPDYLTGERPASGYHDAMRGDGGPDYQSGGYGSQPAFPAGGRQRDDGRFPRDPGGPQSAETDGLGYHEERFVPPYVQGSGDSYLNDDRPRASGYQSDVDDAGYPADVPPVSPPDGYHEAQRPGEAYSSGTEYRRR